MAVTGLPHLKDETIARLEYTVAQLPVSIYWLERDGRISFVNQHACDSLGYTKEELLSLYLWDIDPDYQKERWEQQWKTMQRLGKRTFETRHRRKDGTDFPIEVLACQITFGGKEFHAAYVRDITERNRAREEQMKLEHHLQQAQRLEAIGTLAGGIAHDFNNMLGVILGYAELLKQRLSHDPENVRDLGEIEQAALRSRDITRQLLAFSRKQTIVPVSLNLNEQIATTLKMLGRLIGVHIALDFCGDKELWNNRLDPSQLDQILINLAVNARDAMPDGGKLTITTANVVIDESYAAARSDATPGQFVRLTVQDTGVGMDADTLSRVFEPFFTTKEVGKGTGLGLATIYGIIKQNSGFAEISSVPGRGSSFHIHFPRDTHRDERVESLHMAPDDVASARILLVEDQDMVRGMTARMLESLGHRVVSMSGPLAALNWCESQKGVVDLLLTDIMMPEMSGVELSQMIKNLNPDIRILMMSGYSPALGEQDGAVPEGMNFIQKPFSKSDLARKVEEILKS